MIEIDVAIAQGAFQSVTIDFIVKWKDYYSPIGMFHLYVATFAMNFYEAQAFEGGENFSGRENWEFHIVNSTTS